MAAGINSTQYANRVAVPTKANPKNTFGKVYRAYFTAETLAAGGAIGDWINAVVLPAGARIVGGRLTWDAMTGGTQQVEVGYTGATAQFLASVAMGTSEGDVNFAELLSDGFGDALATETTIQILNSVAAWTASKTIAGYVEFIF
jgi:hypothetical protein